LSLLNESKFEIVDLSHEIFPGMQVFGAEWHKGVTFETLGKIENVGRRTSHIHIGTHSGTHIDAPSHFIVEGKTIDELPLDIFVGNAIKLDLTDIEPRARVDRDFLERRFSETHFEPRVIIDFNWSKNYGTPSFYTEQPFFTAEAAQWLVDKGVQLVGYDTPMLDDPRDGQASECDSPIHKVFLNLGIPLIEYMNNLSSLNDKFMLVAAPLNLRTLDGSPVRCIGINFG
jgi:arylformamidase